MNIIGKKIKIIDSSDTTKIGLEGEVILETARMLLIKSSKGKKFVEKRKTLLVVQDQVISGDKLEGRLEGRMWKC
jgi:RNase P/RNase MRP subunit p29